MQRHRGEHHAGDAHQPFTQQQGQQREPNGSVYPGPDDLLFRKYSQFVNEHQKTSATMPGRRNHEAQGHDQRIAQKIADDRNNPHRKVRPTATTKCGRPMQSTKALVKTVLMAEMLIWAFITIAKLR